MGFKKMGFKQKKGLILKKIPMGFEKESLFKENSMGFKKMGFKQKKVLILKKTPMGLKDLK